MSFEDELGEALRRIGNTFDSDQQTLLTSGLQRGRRTVRRRRVLAVTASVVALGLMGSGAYAGGLLDELRGTEVAKEAPSVDSGRVFEIWKKLVPKGTFSQERVLPRRAGEYAHVSFVYDDGKGAGLVEFRMGEFDPRQATENCPPGNDAKCSSRTASDSARNLYVESHKAPYTTLETKSVRKQIVTPEGFFVEATVWNTPDPKQATGTRKVPVMYDLNRLNANEWREELKKFPKPDPLLGEPAMNPAFVAPSAKVSGAQLIGTLKGLLPNGTISAEKGRGTGDQLGPAASVVHDDGKGRAAIDVRLYRVDPDGYSTRQYTMCRTTGTSIPYDKCKREKLPDGSVVRVYQLDYSVKRQDRKEWRATYVSPRGDMVEVVERDGVAAEGPATRDEPPLSRAQVRALAMSPQWRTALNELPVAPKETVGGPTRPTWDQVFMEARNLGSVRRYIKNGHSHERVCAGACWSQNIVNSDGLGPGMIQIGFDDSKVNKGTEERVSVRQERVEGGGKGVIRWIVTGSRPGGREVIVTAYNAPGPDADATRNSPPINVPMLKMIALDNEWNNKVYLRAAEETLPTG
ncbi:hypothetical protein OG427_17490 [Streptomyces sp. NBC_00133]|uniref:hypothetical protein n=1 Tax=Streptomyces sp. NBC_00133 TaxID=2903624 RepID=UPI00324BE1E5